ncbi:MAG TPA: hypothetical protein VFW28_08445 [Micropepsaceae bacterium]|nr:hypothetical protein [Micropepsaceae bacterium]
MSKHADYLRESEQCQDMADRSNSIDVKARWLTLAGKWLELMSESKGNGAAKFDAMVHDKGTGQEPSDASN